MRNFLPAPAVQRLPAVYHWLKRYHIPALGLLWALVAVLLYQKYQVQVVSDSYRYLLYADILVNRVQDWREINVSYSMYPLLIAAVLKAGGAVGGVVLVQVLLAGVAAGALYKIAMHLTGSWLAAAVSTALYLLWPDFQCWHYYIHTESLLVSLGVLSFYFLLKSSSLWHYLLLCLLLLFCTLLRPNAFVLPFAVVVYGLGKLWLKNRRLFLLVCGAGLCIGLPLFLYLVNAILVNVREMISFVYYYEKGQVFAGYDGWLLSGYQNLKLPDAALPPLVQMLELFRDNLWFCLKAIVVKVAAYFALVRPYYTLPHNLLIVLFMYPVYAFGLFGLWQRQIALPVKAFYLAFILSQAGITGLIAIDWDTRFIIPSMPFLFLFAGIGIAALLKKYFSLAFPENSLKSVW